jgi:Tfp pilus assembly protein PilP
MIPIWLGAASVCAADSKQALDSFRDPFAVPVQASPGNRPRDPLRRYALKDLRLVAIVSGTDSPRGLVEDPTGLGFVIHVGNVIGKEEARVTHIDSRSLHLESTSTAAAGVPLRRFVLFLRAAEATMETD